MFGQSESGCTEKFYLLDEAIVDETIFPGQRGRVKYEGSYWFAYCLQNLTIMPDTLVIVVGKDTERMALIVRVNQPQVENKCLTCEKNRAKPDTNHFCYDLQSVHLLM